MQNIEIVSRRDFTPATQNSHSIITPIIPKMQFECKIRTGKNKKYSKKRLEALRVIEVEGKVLVEAKN